MADRLDVSVILPVFNEAGHLQDELERIARALSESSYTYEIIVIDDGSTDESAELVRDLDGVRVIQFAHNRGSGSARKYGTRAARGRYVVWTDADMTYPNEDIPRLVKEMDGHDQVVGARTSEQGTAKVFRVPAKWFIRKLGSYLTKTRIPDLNSGLRVFRRDVALQFIHLLPPGFSCVTTLTLAFLTNGYSVKYVPIDYAQRAGRSKFHWWTDTRRYLMQVVRMILLWNPLRTFGPPGVALLLVGSGKLIYDVAVRDFRVATNTVVLLVIAAVLLVIGLLADLLVQLNRRPYEVQPAAIYEKDDS